MTIKYFSAGWCQPCKSFSPILSETVLEYPEINLLKMDVDTQADETVKYHIRSVPTMVFEENDEIVKVVTGVRTQVQLKELFQSILSNESKN
jgi:thioredoxin-like negative regulator of GroEL